MVKRQKRSEVPEKLIWDLTDLFSTHTDWENELQAIQQDVEQFSSYKGELGKEASTLHQCMEAYETFQKRVIRVATYANLRNSTDGTDPTRQQDSAKVAQALAKIQAQLSFIQSEILEIPTETIGEFVKQHPALATYRKMLADLIEKKPYTLSPQIEELLAALSEVHNAPYMIYQRSKSSDMVFASISDEQGNELPMSAALYEDRYELTADNTARRNAYHSFVQTLQQYQHTYAAIYATEVTKQVVMAQQRHYDNVTDMLLHPQQVTTDMYHNQLDVIQTELAPHMQRFARLKQEQLGLDELYMCDLKAPLDPSFNPVTTYEEATATIMEALGVMGEDYQQVMKQAIENRWIDLADNVGKATGAFCSSPYGVHPYILITWTDTMRGAFVLAHELGHAGHFYFAGKAQTLFNTRPSTYFIEAPSTLNELLLAYHLLAKTDDERMKRWIITQLLGTYYHNFVTHLLEAEFQRRVYTLAESGTPLTAKVLSEQKIEALANFWGDTVTIDEGAGLTWMRQPHYYMGLYPYTYSAGLTVSTAVAQTIQKEGAPAAKRWIEVLESGGTLKPLDLIQKAGVDMSTPDAIKQAVAFVGSLVDQLETSYREEKQER
ncbi:oligoendopeptidase F [Virgibacillus pantothenticus]|uniref:oligoendopeptidase F n=1 Tax=Virgibacillus pantothenticus TaxID=1473 RepID=UPI001B2E6F1C|nr:oligoendopeptidase F [Virgibacillus pantothenticus]GIP64261.1 oligoendopeptidase F [Virgibacillus pantothenticus]